MSSEMFTLVPPENRNTNGISTPIDSAASWAAIRAQVTVTGTSGTTPSVDVVLEDSLDGETWHLIATFPRMNSAGAQVLDVEGAWGNRIRARWTIGGTLASINFSVIAQLKK